MVLKSSLFLNPNENRIIGNQFRNSKMKSNAPSASAAEMKYACSTKPPKRNSTADSTASSFAAHIVSKKWTKRQVYPRNAQIVGGTIPIQAFPNWSSVGRTLWNYKGCCKKKTLRALSNQTQAARVRHLKERRGPLKSLKIILFKGRTLSSLLTM